ncbi:MAG: GAF domain-containing protein, partial [Sphingomonadaceae bacterium]|nr:GAF domain-containing protein [Sphingomonadaceae bacterium]
DEFVLLRAIDDLSDGYAIADAVHARLCDALGLLRPDVTCSMGAVIVQAGDIADHQRLLAMADALMYEVKRDGKNSLRLALAADERGFAPPPVRAGEAARQTAVDRLDLSRIGRSASLQAMVHQAAEIIGTPIAAISIIDRDRQWFVADKGLDVGETPRAVSFCAHAIDGDVAMVVNDAALDARFGGNPLVRGHPGIRFYAGAPLVTSQGDKLGALCVIDTRPRELSAEQTAALTALATRVAHELEQPTGGERR